jgi:ribose 1,5-bisphosphokinase PhnN
VSKPAVAGAAPAEVAARLRKMSDVATDLAAELDVLRGRLPARGPHSADSLAVALDQAAAAAHDLHSSATTAAGIADRMPPADG